MNIVRTDTGHPDFLAMTAELDAELHHRYGQRQGEYDRLNNVYQLATAVVGYVDTTPVACGCYKALDRETAELKRMFVASNFRGRGFGLAMVRELEQWAAESGFRRIVLETGKGQPEAIRLYHRGGYTLMANYGPYAGNDNSVCLEKTLPASAAMEELR
jgi:putative acetyltransferase